jgi:outer membrane protein
MKKNIMALVLISCFFIAPVLAKELLLKDSIEIALNNNPQVIQADENAAAVRAKWGQAMGSFLPRITVDASLGQSYIESPSIELPPSLGGGSFSSGANSAGNITSYSLTLTQPIFSGGRLIQEYSIAYITYQVALENLRQIQNQTSFNVTSNYYALMKAQKSLEVIKSSIANLKRNLEQTQVFYDAGIVSNIDLLRGKTQLANLEIIRIQMENAVKLARETFISSLGFKPDYDFTLMDPRAGQIKDISYSQEALVELAFENRPEWKAYRLGLEAAEKGLSVAYSSFLPKIDYIYSMGRSSAEYPNASAYDSSLGNWRSMLVASWTIFNGFRNVNQINEVRASFQAAKANARLIKDGIALEVKSAYLNLASAAENISANAVAADLAEKTLKLAEVNYKANIISEQAYLDAHTADQSAQVNLWFARYDYEIARAKLNQMVGKTVI